MNSKSGLLVVGAFAALGLLGSTLTLAAGRRSGSQASQGIDLQQVARGV